MGTRGPSNSQRGKWPWSGGEASGGGVGGWERGGGGTGAGNRGEGGRPGAGGPAPSAHPFVPLRTEGQTGGRPRENGPRGLGSPRPRPDPDRAEPRHRTYLAAAPRPAPVESEEPSGRAGPSRGGGSRGKRAGGRTFARAPPLGARRGGRSELQK